MTIAFARVRGAVIHALGGEEDHQHQHDGLDVAAPLELGELEHRHGVLQVGHVRPGEQPPHGAAGAPGPEGGRHVRGAAVVALREMVPHRAEIGPVAALVPCGGDGFGDQRRLDVVDRAPAPSHPPDDAGQHGEALFPVVAVVGGRPGVDHGEGVEAGRVLAEGDERAFKRLGRVLEGAPVVDHHRLAAGADEPGHQLLHQHRLARARLPRDRHVVVAGLVGEGRPAGRLAAPPYEEQGRGIVGV